MPRRADFIFYPHRMGDAPAGLGRVSMPRRADFIFYLSTSSVTLETSRTAPFQCPEGLISFSIRKLPISAREIAKRFQCPEGLISFSIHILADRGRWVEEEFQCPEGLISFSIIASRKEL